MSDAEKLADLATKPYKAQAIWFLNSFWPTVNEHAEKIWTYEHHCEELDDKKSAGCALDELQVRDYVCVLNSLNNLYTGSSLLGEVSRDNDRSQHA